MDHRSIAGAKEVLGGTLLASLAALVLVAWPQSVAAAPPDAELITVTDTRFVATWTTSQPSDTTVCFARAGQAETCRRTEISTRFHRAQVGGLEPGRRYTYSLRSAGVPEPPSPTNPGTFTTLVPPPGRHLFNFALVSDVHIGEKCSGTGVTLPSAGSVPPCFKTEEGESGHPYSATMARATVEELNKRDIGVAIFNADNTSHGEYEEVAEFREIFSELEAPWRVARGSHDRADQNPDDPRCGADNDCFRALLFPEREPGRIFYSFNHGHRHHFVALDSAKPGSGTGELNEEQLEFLKRDLARARRQGRRTFIFFHHPVTEYANTTAFPPIVFGVPPHEGGQAFLEEVGRHPRVVGVMTSHTHRNYVSYSPRSGVETVFFENGPTKEYPGGYSVVRVYTGGYMRNFHRLGCEFCRQWTSTTRDQYFGLYPLYTLGTLSARNFTHVYGCAAPTPPPSPPLGHESGTGGDTARPACPSGDSDGRPPGDGDGDGDGDGGADGDGGHDGGRGGGGDGGGAGTLRGADRVGTSAGARRHSAESGRELPFTGLATAALLVAGAALLVAGAISRRRGP